MKYKKFNDFSKNVYYPNTVVNESEVKDFQELYKIRPNELINSKLELPSLIASSTLNNLLDIFNNVILSGSYSIICSNIFLNELSLFNISKHSIFNIDILFQGERSQYNYVHFPYPSNEVVDFPNCDFLGTTMTSFYADPSKNT